MLLKKYLYIRRIIAIKSVEIFPKGHCCAISTRYLPYIMYAIDIYFYKADISNFQYQNLKKSASNNVLFLNFAGMFRIKEFFKPLIINNKILSCRFGCF